MRPRGLTGYEEEACIALAEAGAPVRRAVSALIAGCVDGLRDEGAAEALSIGAREALALAIRAQSFDGPMRARLRCESCGEALDLSLDPLALMAPTSGTAEEFESDSLRLRCRAVTAADQAAVAGLTGEVAASALLARCVTAEDADGPRDITTLPEALREATAARLFDLDPMAETRLACACPGCGGVVEGVLDAGAFLVEEIARRGPALSREVLLIARATGWTEDAILALPRRRRLRYAALLSGEAA